MPPSRIKSIKARYEFMQEKFAKIAEDHPEIFKNKKEELFIEIERRLRWS